MWFLKKQPPANDVDLSICNPVIVNRTNESIVIFMDRGVLYNKQILAPGEAVGMTRSQTAGTLIPYQIHALVGNEKNLPTRMQSAKNCISAAVIPTAFIIGTLTAAYSAGTMTGPAAALSRAAGGMVIKGMVIDSAALAAGSVAASRAAIIADKLIEKKPQNFSAKTGLYRPGKRFVVIHGGIDQPLNITTIPEKKFRLIPIVGEVKTPMDTLQDKAEYYMPSIFQRSVKPEENKVGAITENQQQQVQEQLQTEMVEDGKSRKTVEEEIAITEDQQQKGQGQLKTDSEEDRDFHLAIEESLKMEEERRKELHRYETSMEESRNPVSCCPVLIFQ